MTRSGKVDYDAVRYSFSALINISKAAFYTSGRENDKVAFSLSGKAPEGTKGDSIYYSGNYHAYEHLDNGLFRIKFALHYNDWKVAWQKVDCHSLINKVLLGTRSKQLLMQMPKVSLTRIFKLKSKILES